MVRRKKKDHTMAVMSARQARKVDRGEPMESDPSDYQVNRTAESVVQRDARLALEDRRLDREIDDYFSL